MDLLMKKQKDIKTLENILFLIDHYINGKLYIGDLVCNLESLLDLVLTAEEKWKSECIALWLDIEVAYALSLDQEAEGLTPEGREIIEVNLNKIKKLVLDKLQEIKRKHDKDHPIAGQFS